MRLGSPAEHDAFVNARRGLARAEGPAFALYPAVAQAVSLSACANLQRAGPLVNKEARWRQRRAEFQAGRMIAARLLAEMGAVDTVVDSAADRSPRWPRGFVGSITHAAGITGVAVARARDVRAIGIDIEPIVAPAVAEAIEVVCLGCREKDLLQACGDRATAATVFFSAKEALFKCLNPLTGCWLDFKETEIAGLDFEAGRLQVRLLRNMNHQFHAGRVLTGAFRCEGGRVFSSFELVARRGSNNGTQASVV